VLRHLEAKAFAETGSPSNLKSFGVDEPRDDSPPRRHWRFLSDDNPRPLTTLAQQRVELGATNGDGATIWQGYRAALRLDGCDQVAFRG
jgi:hypothetical protein